MVDYTLKNKKGYVLSDEQNEIVDALLKNDFYFNCAQTGFGKTFATITAAVHTIVSRKDEDIHFVLLLPPSAVKAFKDTLSGILGIPFNIYSATAVRATKGARFHIFNYSSIGQDVFSKDNSIGTNFYFEALKDLKRAHKNLFLIADEMHSLQDPKTIQYRLVNAIRPWFIGIWGLTATPILNSLIGFFHMTNIVKPNFFASNEFSFRNKFCELATVEIWKTKKIKGKYVKTKKDVKEIVGYKNLDLLREKFTEISIIRAKHYDFNFIYRSAELTDSAIKYYRYAAAGLFSGTINKKTGKPKKSKQQHAGARLHDLQRVISNSHKDFKLIEDQNYLSDKEVLLVETIKEVLAKNEAVLIYFSYLETLDRIKFILDKIKEKFGIPTIHEISGNINHAKRKLVEEAIKPRDVVLITSAGTESINLQKANNLIFYEIPFPLREFVQACGRIARTNSEFSQFNVYILEANKTIDTYKKNRLMANMGLIKSILGNSNSLPIEVLIISEEDKQAMKNELLWWK